MITLEFARLKNHFVVTQDLAFSMLFVNFLSLEICSDRSLLSQIGKRAIAVYYLKLEKGRSQFVFVS
jgi:hypothetical protein